MNKFILSALAVSVAGAPSLAGSETDDWTGLDQDIEALASSLAQGGSGASVSGFLRSSYNHSGDSFVDAPGGTTGLQDAGEGDLGGFNLDNARINVSGNVGDYSIYVQLEGATAGTGVNRGLPTAFGTDSGGGAAGIAGGSVGGGVAVLDAYVSFTITDQITGTMGQFRPPFLGSALRDENQLLFIDRTAVGNTWAFRDQGIMFSGAFDQLNWWIAAQNGVLDLQGDELAFSARVAFNALGNGTGSVEGAYGAGDESNLTVAAAYYTDDAFTDGDAIAFEAAYTRGALYLAAELVDWDLNTTGGTSLPATGNPITGAQLYGDTLWALTAAYMVAPDEWEVALRWEEYDTPNVGATSVDASLLTVGVNKYMQGHDAKWQLNYTKFDTDTAFGQDVDTIALALVVSI